jgi:hypothetical protein
LVGTDNGLKPTIYHTRGEQANQYTTDAVKDVLKYVYLLAIIFTHTGISDREVEICSPNILV